MGHTLQFEVVEAGASSSDDEGGLTAPMPGKILEVKVADGQTVEAGELLLVMEAMKMEHAVKAVSDGKISEMYVKTGDQVESGANLLKID